MDNLKTIPPTLKMINMVKNSLTFFGIASLYLVSSGFFQYQTISAGPQVIVLGLQNDSTFSDWGLGKQSLAVI